MNAALASAIAGLVAAVLTLFDLDKTFYLPARIPQKIRLYAWWFGFPIINGLIAALLFTAIGDSGPLKGLPEWFRAVTVGAAYLALVRLKFTTLDVKGKEVPFGLELFYEAAKGFAYKRINRIAMEARRAETIALAESLTLPELISRAKLAIDQNSLLTSEDRTRLKSWLLKTVQDQSSSDLDKRQTVANYVLSGQPSE